MSQHLRLLAADSRLWLLLALVVTALIYAPGLAGGFIFDDFPNIVENRILRSFANGPAALVAALFSSGSSDLQRPLAMLSFLVNLATTGIDPLAMKATNLLIHLVNGVLVYQLTRVLGAAAGRHDGLDYRWLAAFVMAAWLLAPVNLTPVLYVVQRMEGLSHTFVFLALLIYARYRSCGGADPLSRPLAVWIPLLLLGGLLVKESGALLVVYLFVLEWLLFRFEGQAQAGRALRRYFIVVLWLPGLLGAAYLWMKFATQAAFATRPFTLDERLLTQFRVVLGYVDWTLLPRLDQLGLYHDDVAISRGWLQPVSTLLSAAGLLALAALAVLLRRQRPLIALGLLLFFAAQLITATFLPLDLAYEHRNYFASFGLLLAAGSLLVGTRGGAPLSWRVVPVFALLLLFGTVTVQRVAEWSDPLRLAEAEAQRRPQSPRATYEYGRMLIVSTGATPDAAQIARVLQALEHAAGVPGASVLPEQALLIFASQQRQPIRPEWWASLSTKLRAAPPDVSDTSSLYALVACVQRKECAFALRDMLNTFGAALAHQPPSAEALTVYANYAANVLADAPLALRLMDEVVVLRPRNAQYRHNRAELLISMGRPQDAEADIAAIRALNRFGREQPRLDALRQLLESGRPPRFAPQ